MQSNSGFCMKSFKLLSGNGQLIGAETRIYSDFNLEEYPQDAPKMNIKQNIKLFFLGLICWINWHGGSISKKLPTRWQDFLSSRGGGKNHRNFLKSLPDLY